MKWVTIEYNSKTIRVPAEKIKGVTWFHFEGQTYSYEPEAIVKEGQSQVSLNESILVSPMPGKILKVLCKPHQNVKKGDVLIVLEAMKMEYSLESEIDGQVNELNAKEGELVSLQQKLVVVQRGEA